MKKGIILVLSTLLFALILEFVGFNFEAWHTVDNNGVDYQRYYGEGIEWNEDGYLYVNDISMASVGYSHFDQSPENAYLNFDLKSSDKSSFDLLVTEFYGDGSSVTYHHLLDYQRPYSMYLNFDKPIIGFEINIKDMESCVIDDSTLQFNQDVPFDFVTSRFIKNGISFAMVGLIIMILSEKWSSNNG